MCICWFIVWYKQYPNYAFTSCTIKVNCALVSEKNVSFRRFVIKSWNYYIICHMIIKVWTVRAIKKVALLSTRYNILLCSIWCSEEIYDIFIFMRPTLLLPTSFLPLPQFAYLTQFKDTKQLYLWCWTKMPPYLLVVLPDRNLKLGRLYPMGRRTH